MSLEDSLDLIGEQMAKDKDHFVACVGEMIVEVRKEHFLWANACKTPHWHDDYPCDEFERAMVLGVAWLAARAGLVRE